VGAVLDTILSEVPAAECFRWELRTESEQRIIERTMGAVGAVPARTISLVDSANGQMIDPASGAFDIESKHFRFYFNPYYAHSESFRAGRDIPALSALLYLQTLFEAGLKGDQLLGQPGWGQAADAVRTCQDHEVLRQLEEHAYLRARFWYLALNAYAAAPTRADFQFAAESLGFKLLLKPESLPGSLLRPLQSLVQNSTGMTFTSSAHLRGDAYRFDRTLSVAMDLAPPDIVLATNRQAALFTMSPNAMHRGIAPSAAKASGGSEFLHLALPQGARSACAQIQDDARLSAIVQFGDFKESWVSVPLPCVVQRKDPADDRLFLRVNLFGLPEAMLNAGKSMVRVCLLGLLGEG
jgi:hypothetical protein